MTDRAALREALLILTTIANVAGGYVSRADRKRIDDLWRHYRAEPVDA